MKFMTESRVRKGNVKLIRGNRAIEFFFNDFSPFHFCLSHIRTDRIALTENGIFYRCGKTLTSNL